MAPSACASTACSAAEIAAAGPVIATGRSFGSAVTAGQAKASTMTATTPTRASAMPSTLPMGVRAVVASGWAAMVSSKKANVRSLL